MLPRATYGFSAEAKAIGEWFILLPIWVFYQRRQHERGSALTLQADPVRCSSHQAAIADTMSDEVGTNTFR